MRGNCVDDHRKRHLSFNADIVASILINFSDIRLRSVHFGPGGSTRDLPRIACLTTLLQWRAVGL
jgi:hypothetical protein